MKYINIYKRSISIFKTNILIFKKYIKYINFSRREVSQYLKQVYRYSKSLSSTSIFERSISIFIGSIFQSSLAGDRRVRTPEPNCCRNVFDPTCTWRYCMSKTAINADVSTSENFEVQ